MIINIRGTHGSGKSTLARRVMELYETRITKTAPGRSRPIGYLCESPTYAKLFVPGSYETPTGGCDTISEVATTYELVATYAAAGVAVMFEGILAQHSTGRLMELHQRYPVTVISLSTPLETCVESVMQRRAARGQTGDFDPRNVNREHAGVSRGLSKLRAAGMTVLELSRDAALDMCRSLLSLSSDTRHLQERLAVESGWVELEERAEGREDT